MELSRKLFDKLREYVFDACGLVIPDEKEYLINHRLRPILKAEGCDSWKSFYSLLEKNARPGLKDQVVSAMTTNETSFFRDGNPFQVFQNVVLPRLGALVAERKDRAYARKGSKVRLWCAASSTGQEPYSMSMLIHEYCETQRRLGRKGLDVRPEDFSILATDISSQALARAIAGEYSELEIKRGLPDGYRKHFTKHGGSWILDDDIKELVEFRQINLTRNFQALGGFDSIACRNVLIYFDIDTKRRILEGMYGLLAPGGELVLGAQENMHNVFSGFQSRREGSTTLYVKS